MSLYYSKRQSKCFRRKICFPHFLFLKIYKIQFIQQADYEKFITINDKQKNTAMKKILLMLVIMVEILQLSFGDAITDTLF